MTVIHSFLLVLFVFTNELHQVFAIKCLSCHDVLQPRYCTVVRQCPDYNSCLVQKYLTISGDTRFHLDCALESCHSSHFKGSEKNIQSQNNREKYKNSRFSNGILNNVCEECCHGDLCNSQGCGVAGYPPDRGLMCYNCPQESDPTKCEKFTFCGKDEMCGLYVMELFGDRFYSSHCTRKYDCDIMHLATSGFGRRQLEEKLCTQCCGTDLCNDNCSLRGTTTNPAMTTTVALTETTGAITDETTRIATTEAATTQQQIYHDTISYEFILMFPQAYSSLAHRILQAVIASDKTGNMTVAAPYIYEDSSLILTPGFNYVNLSMTLQGNGTEVQQKAIYLRSSTPMSVFGLNQWHGSAEAYLALPIYALGMTYTIVSIEPTRDFSNFMIATTENDTEIVITFRLKYGGIQIRGRTYTNGMTYRLRLNDRLQTFHVTHEHDLTGTNIVSNKKIAVVSGTTCSHVLQNVGVCQPLQEYLIPTSSWGTDFVIPALFTDHNGCILKLWPAVDNTMIHMYNVLNKSSIFTLRLSVGKSFTYSQFQPMYIKSDKPIQVVLFTSESTQRAATMLNIPSVQQYDTRYNIAVPKIGNYQNQLVIVSKTEDQAGILVKGNITNQSASRTYSFRYGNYTLQYLDVTGSNFYLKHSNYKPFGVFVTGVSTSDDHVSYSYPGGMKFLHS